jgi:hypothetical protein
MKLNLTLLLSFITLSACTPYAETFDCSPGRGVGCQSLTTINRMVEDGKLPLEDDSNKSPEKESSQGNESDPPAKETPLIEASNPLKLNPSTHLKVWVAGYEEKVGSERFFHGSSFVYVSR